MCHCLRRPILRRRGEGDDVREQGDLSPATREWLLENFDWDEDDLGDECTDAADRVKHLARRISHEKKILRSQYRAVEAKEALEQAATVASLALPSTNATNKILRYESAIQRQLAQAMNQLERLQQAREGHTVPPTISVTVSQ